MKAFLARVFVNVKAFVLWLWSFPVVSRAAHTFWQAFLAVFLVGISPIITLLLHQSYNEAAVALLALTVAAAAAGLSAVKTSLWPYIKALLLGSQE